VLRSKRPYSCEGIAAEGPLLALQFFRYSSEERSREIRLVDVRTGRLLYVQQLPAGWDRAFCLLNGNLIGACERDVELFVPNVAARCEDLLGDLQGM